MRIGHVLNIKAAVVLIRKKIKPVLKLKEIELQRKTIPLHRSMM